MDGFHQLTKNNPQLPNRMPAAEPFFMVQNEDPELDAMLENIFRGDGDGSLNN
jgi:hypothetical protein